MKEAEKQNPMERGDSIAIIGLGGRFPSAGTIDTFWMKISKGHELIRELSDEELLEKGVSPELLKNDLYVKRSPDMGNIDGFDASFFGYTPREAELMDPQQRIFLECAWQLLETTGYLNQADHFRIGVSAGSSLSSYLLNNIIPALGIENAAEDVRVRTGNDKDFLATRVAYKCNLKGPAISINTACSTSLVAIWKACEEIRAGNAELMLAGGISVTTPEGLGYLYQEGGIAAPDGVCRPFDENGRGTIGGNGCGILMLKKLSQAMEDGDPIHAVILGGAVNNDGSEKIGFTAPSVTGQKEVIEQALNDAGITPDTVGLIEAHGTGTTLGDPIELQALHEAYGNQTDQPLYLGSVKANIGHLDAAAGVAGVIKAVLSLQKRIIPPLANFSKHNPQFHFETSRFQIPTDQLNWETKGTMKRRAAVSSFGLGGTNAHIILEEPPQAEPVSRPEHPVLFRISARSEDAVRQLRQALADRLENNPGISLSDAAHTLTKYREEYDHRFSFAAVDHHETIQKLQNSLKPDLSGAAPVTAFAFPGQGTHYRGMIQNLYVADSGFKSDMDQCSKIIKHLTGHDILDILLNDQTPEEVLQQLDVSPAVQFAVSYSIANWWKNHGVTPSYVIGHSFGEYVAACFSGLFSLEDGLMLVIKRGLLTQKLPKGSMMAIAVGEPEARKLADEYGLSLATVNSASQCVLSGSDESVDRLCGYCDGKDIFNRKLRISYASHSEIIDLIADEYREIASRVTFRKPEIPIISNLTGRIASDDEIMQADYWVNHMRRPVLFANGLQTLTSLDCEMVIETGPGDTLNKLILQSNSGIRSLPSLGKKADEEVVTLYESLGKMWSLGSNITWQDPNTQNPAKVDLPATPFVHSRFWIDPPDATQFSGTVHLSNREANLKQKEADTDNWFYYPEWKRVQLPPAFQTVPDTTFVIIGPDNDTSQKVETLLKDYGVSVKRLLLTKSQLSGTPSIDPGNPSDYDQLLASLPANCEKIVFIPPIESDDPYITLKSLLFTAQALSVSDEMPFECIVITERSQIVTGSEELNLAQAGIAGLLRVLDQEQAQRSFRIIDIESPDSITEKAFSRELLAEKAPILSAIRGSHRWTHSYKQLQKSDLPLAENALKKGGTYLITGGLGNVGLLLADLLRREWDANVVLTGRTPLPDDEDIQKWEAGTVTDRFSAAQFVKPLNLNLASLNEELRSEFQSKVEGVPKSVTMDHHTFSHLSNALCGRTLFEAVCRSIPPDQTFQSKDSFKRALKPEPAYERYVDFITEVLTEDGYLTQKNGDWVLTETADPSTADLLKQQILKEFPEFKSQIEFVEKSAANCLEVILGLKNGVEVLFSSNEEQAEDDHSEANRLYFNIHSGLIKSVIRSLISEHPDRKIRILEIGAGNGLLTDTLIKGLDKTNIEYLFTDVSHTFVRNAQKRYSGAAHNFMKFQTFDISKSPADQDIPLYTYDLVIGLNVVHATPDLQKTLSNLRSVLRPGGLCGIVETVQSERWDSIIWGLTPEWWAFTDTQHRTDSPLISAEKWRKVFELSHFEPVLITPETEDSFSDCDSALILGQQPANLNPLHDPDYKEFIDRNIGDIGNRVSRLNRIIAHQGDGTVVTEQADVADRSAMEGVIRRTRERFGVIDGVIHAAGVVSGDSIFTLSAETTALDIEKQNRPKAEGLKILNELLADEPLDFCLLLSSNASVIGGLGLTAYASANTYMDQFAASTFARLPYISANWDGWPNENSSNSEELGPSSSISFFSMTLNEAEQIFRRVTTMPQIASQISVSSGSLHQRLNKWDQKSASGTVLEKEMELDNDSGSGNRPNLATAYEPVSTETEKELKFIWSKLLGVKPIGIHDNFFELNGDSLLGTQLISKINQKFNLHLPLRSLFEDLTIAKMAGRVDGEINHSNEFQLSEEEEYEEGEL